MQEENKPKKSYWGIIPAEVRYCKELSGGDPKHLYSEISALCNERGYCWAKNDYFADLYGVDTRTVQRWLNKLVEYNFVVISFDNGDRKIYLANSYEAPNKSQKEPVAKKTKVQQEVKYTENDLMIAELLRTKIVGNFPVYENRQIKISEWAEDIRKLREIDQATPEQIVFMITWVQGGQYAVAGKDPRTFEMHHFWAKNILSARKLRKQWFENLVPQLQVAIADLKKPSKPATKIEAVQL